MQAKIGKRRDQWLDHGPKGKNHLSSELPSKAICARHRKKRSPADVAKGQGERGGASSTY